MCSGRTLSLLCIRSDAAAIAKGAQGSGWECMLIACFFVLCDCDCDLAKSCGLTTSLSFAIVIVMMIEAEIEVVIDIVIVIILESVVVFEAVCLTL